MIHRFSFVALAASLAAAGQAQGQTPMPIPAGETLTLSLDDAVRRAVEHNPDLAIDRLATEVEAAHVGEARTAYTPLFFTTLGRSTDTVPPTNFLLGDRGVDTRDWFSTTGVRQRVPWGGGSWSITWDASRTTSNNPLNSFDPTLQSGFQLALSQPLLKDRRMDSARQQYVVAKRNQESSDARFHESVVQTVAAVKQTYWTLKALRANVMVQQRSLELAQELAKQNRVRVQVGQSPPLDLVQVEAEVADRRENLIRAIAAADDGEDRLRRLIMDPQDASFWNVRLDTVDEPRPHEQLPQTDEVVAKALKERYDLAQARNDVSIAATNVEYFTNQKLPDVRIESSYRTNGLAGTQLVRSGAFPGVVTGTIHSGFGDAVGQLFGRDYPTWSLGLTVNYPIGRSYEEVSAVRASVERRQAAERVASLQLDVAETIRQAARQVRSTAEREDAARAGAAFAEQRFAAEQRRYDVGLSTTFLVTQAQRDLLQAQVNLLQATLDYQSSLVSFEALQLAPAVSGSAVRVNGSTIVSLPAPSPRGVFRSAAGVQP